ncbi:MAG: methyltransferase FkbM family [Rhodospirillales bacterium]|nr:methyltransferase FkbM family [Rhodospirillales bacterium]
MIENIRSAIAQAKDLRNFIHRHDLTRRSLTASYWRVLRWQFVSRLSAGPFDVAYVNDTRLMIRRGMVGATGNVYAGLHEFPEMAFVLHFLRGGDLFADVGANVGTYTVLASGVCQARTVAFEPIADARASMQGNIERNAIGTRAEVRPVAVSARPGQATMTNRDDTMNRIVRTATEDRSTEIVPVSTLDVEFSGETPALIKIDAEGSDGDVVFGAKALIQRAALKAIIAEFAGIGSNEAAAHAFLLQQGFHACSYEPFARRLIELETYTDRTIYVRDRDFVRQRLLDAPKFRVLGHEI